MADDCQLTFGGYEGAVGWIEEAACSVTPTGALTGFGFVKSVEPLYTKGMVKGRQVGSQKLAYQKQGEIEAGVTVEYTPVDAKLDNTFLYALGSTSGHTEHLHTRSIERGVNRVDPAGQERELWNLCKVNSLTMAVAVGEEWAFTEELMAQYMQHSDSKSYAGYQTVTVGADPVAENDEPLMFYDGNIEICYFQNESFTGITGTSQAVAFAPEDINNDSDLTNDVHVFINGIEDVIVSVVGTTVTWTTTVTAPDTIIIQYFKAPIQLTDITDISIEIARNLTGQRGIKQGIPIIYELVEGSFEATISLTENFATYEQLDEMIDDNPVCLYIGIGTKVFRLLKGKFEGPPGPYTPEDLIAVALDAEFEDVVVA